jgi:hypothetical protein
MSQLGLFGDPPARANTAVTAPPAEVCAHHGPEFVCSMCPAGYATDSTGFVHTSLLKGRVALRVCQRCVKLRSAGRWNHADWWHCADCQPLGTISEESRPAWEAIHGSWAELQEKRNGTR